LHGGEAWRRDDLKRVSQEKMRSAGDTHGARHNFGAAMKMGGVCGRFGFEGVF